MEIKLDIIKILAEGTEKRFMWVKYGQNLTDIKCIKINDKIYQYLKKEGVPTSQYLARRKDNG